MKLNFKTLLFAVLGIVMFSFTANAQLTPSNSLGIFPPRGAFNPARKFIAIGESGGVPGPTANGCDLYGFRAQFSTTQAVNLGIQFNNGRRTPTLSFESQVPMLIQQQNAFGLGGGPVTGCGKTLASYFDSQAAGGASNVVYFVFGSAFASGGVWAPSDKNLKRNIQPLSNAMEILQEIEGVTYEYRTDERPELNLNEGRQYGFIAQDVQKVMPEATQGVVNQDGEMDDYIAMNYDMIIPVLTEAVKEQDETIKYQEEVINEQTAEIESLQDRITMMERDELEPLRDRIARLEKLLLGNQPASSSVELRQNRPNPANGMTIIEYSIPQDMNNADLVVYDVRGVELQRVSIAAGNGNIEYNTNNFNSGIYFYSIEANGQNLARKKMVIK
ncbi:MAG: tail fiber domain-containing protein [Bacteroidota bacterium]